MRKAILIPVIVFFISCGEDKMKRPSPPATVNVKTNSGNEIGIDYSQPGVKNREIGKEIAPYGQVWRTGANEATVFEITRDAKIEGHELPAGRYSLYSVPGKDQWIFIFNKMWDQWGTEYDQKEDALRVSVTPGKSPRFVERMTFSIDQSGKVVLQWGNVESGFHVQ